MTVKLFVQDVLTVHEALFLRSLSMEEQHSGEAADALTRPVRGFILVSVWSVLKPKCDVRHTRALLSIANKTIQKLNADATEKGHRDFEGGSWARAKTDVQNIALEDLVEKLKKYEQGTRKAEMILRKAQGNIDNKPEEFQRLSVQYHTPVAKELLVKYVLFTGDRPNLCANLPVHAEIKDVLDWIVTHVVCEPATDSATKTWERVIGATRGKDWMRKRTITMPPCWSFCRTSCLSPVQCWWTMCAVCCHSAREGVGRFRGQ